MYNETVSRPNKERIITRFFLDCGKPAETYLCLPSSTMLDIKVGRDLGVITDSTKIIAVERDKVIAQKIKNKLGDVLVGDITDFTFDKPIDVAYIDLCGQLTADVVCWLNLHQHMFNKNFAITLSKVPRSRNTYYQKLIKLHGSKAIRECLRWCFKPLSYKEYMDARTPMVFGYRTVRKASKVDLALYKFKQRNKSVQCAAGFTNFFNHLTPGEKAAFKRKLN